MPLVVKLQDTNLLRTLDTQMRFLLALVLIFFPGAALAEDLLATLRKEHPRLLVLAENFKTARQNAIKDPRAKVYYDQIASDCGKFLDQPPVKRGGGRM